MHEKLGILVSETEQIDMVSGTFLSPVIVQMFTNPQTGMFDVNFLRNFVASIPNDPSGSSDALWQYIKTTMNKERMNTKYMTLVGRGMFVTDAEIDQAIADNSKSYQVSYVSAAYNSIPDSTVSVSNSDIKAYYNAHRNDFKRTAVRDVEYVLFNVEPSNDDFLQAATVVDGLAAEFAASESPMQYAQLNSHSTPDTRYLKDLQLSGNMAIMAEKGDLDMIEGPVLAGNTYTMTRISDVKMIPDSVGAKHILLPATSAEQADSIVRAIKGGAAFADLSTQYSLDTYAASQGGDLGHFAPEQMVPEFADAVVASRVGDVFVVESQFGLHVVQTTFKMPAVKKTQFATVVYEIEPSAATDQIVYSNASSFFEQATGSQSNFDAAVNEQGVSKRVARINPTDLNATGLADSREMVRWAYNQKAGDVSSIMKIGEDYVVALLTSVQEDGFAPVEKVASEITPLVRQEKKAELLAAKMTGSTLDQVAQAIGKEVGSSADVEFNSYYFEGAGMESKLIGAVTGAKQGALSKVVDGITGVYMFTVDSQTDIETPVAKDEQVRLQAISEAYISDRVTQAFMLKADIKDYRVKFF